jgi:hypothetical protein
MTKTIKFHAINKHTAEVKQKPIPASQCLPEWFTSMSPFDGKKLEMDPLPTVTAKRCAPLLDSLTSGYIAHLWADLFVTQTENGAYIQWGTEERVADAWPWRQSSTYEVPGGFDRTVFKYFHGWVIETPPQYSCLITHPFGYQDLPIRTITGVIDSDILKTSANSPFVVKSGFEGVIEKGTPMFQIIPFKRDNWKATYDVMDEDEDFINNEKLRTKLISAYSSIRSKKSYK